MTAPKTHCRKGHRMDAANTLYSERTDEFGKRRRFRRCKRCTNEVNRGSYHHRLKGTQQRPHDLMIAVRMQNLEDALFAAMPWEKAAIAAQMAQLTEGTR